MDKIDYVEMKDSDLEKNNEIINNPNNRQISQENNNQKMPYVKKESPRKHKFSRPQFIIKVKLQTHEAQVVFVHTSKKINQMLHSLMVIYPTKGVSQDLIDKILTKYHEFIDQLEADLNKETEKITEIIKSRERNISEIEYSTPQLMEIRIMTPEMNCWCGLTEKLDRFVMVLDSCWLQGILSQKQRKETSYFWEHKIFKFFGEFISEYENITKQNINISKNKSSSV